MPFPAPETVDRLRADGIVSDLRWHAEVTSTNALALAAAEAGADGWTVVGADVQTAGRGRRGRAWVAPAGSSVMCSIVVRPTLPTSSWTVLPLMVGLAVHDVASTVCPDAEVTLKWPNDLLVEGVKAAGVLLESVGGAVVLGVGLNVDWRGVERPDGLVATSLAEVAGVDVDRDRVLDLLLRRMHARHATACADPAGVVTDYLPCCGTIGRRVVAIGVEGAEGTAVALSPEGHLRIRPDEGADVVVRAGEVQHLR